MAATAQRIRPAGDRDVPRALEALRRAGFAGDGIVRLVDYPRLSPQGTILVAERDGAIDGVACCASFGPSGWIGALGVVPGARRRGLGAALPEAAAGWLQAHGARAVLLYATEMGRPVYERLGFEHEGPATAWRGVAGRRRIDDGMQIRPLRAEDRRAIQAVDRHATGEDRRAVLDTLRPGAGVAAVDPDGRMRGWASISPWGSGAAIAAVDPVAGGALLGSAAAGPVPSTIVVPDANRDAKEMLRGWGFARLNDAARMRLGEPLHWRPECQFGLWNLFWG